MILSLDDRLAIEDLSARYNVAIDSGDIDTWVDCFTESGEFATEPPVGPAPRFPSSAISCQGRTALFELGKRIRSGPRMRHWCDNRVLTLLADGGVEGISYMTILLLDGPSEGQLMSGIMHDRLVRDEDGWRFQSRLIRFDR